MLLVDYQCQGCLSEHCKLIFTQLWTSTNWHLFCRLKRKSTGIICYEKKRQCLREERRPDADSPEKQTHVERNKQDASSIRAEKPGEPVTGLTWSHSLPSTQTVMVSPLSRTEGPWSRELPLKGGEREAKVQKLAALEKEVQGLRRLLDLEVTKTSQGTMTAADGSADDPKDLTASTASTEVGCQTDMAEVSRVFILASLLWWSTTTTIVFTLTIGIKDFTPRKRKKKCSSCVGKCGSFISLH